MVDSSYLDDVYAALADASRRAIVSRLAQEGELRVTDVADQFAMSLNGVSKHIKVLQRAGIVQRRIVGRDHWLSLDLRPIQQGWAWMGLYQRFWETRLEALDAYLRKRRSERDSGGSLDDR